MSLRAACTTTQHASIAVHPQFRCCPQAPATVFQVESVRRNSELRTAAFASTCTPSTTLPPQRLIMSRRSRHTRRRAKQHASSGIHAAWPVGMRLQGVPGASCEQHHVKCRRLPAARWLSLSPSTTSSASDADAALLSARLCCEPLCSRAT